jgi:hypothetical protein
MWSSGATALVVAVVAVICCAEDAGRRGGVLSTAGSFTLFGGNHGNRAGNSEDDLGAIEDVHSLDTAPLHSTQDALTRRLVAKAREAQHKVDVHMAHLGQQVAIKTRKYASSKKPGTHEKKLGASAASGRWRRWRRFRRWARRRRVRRALTKRAAPRPAVRKLPAKKSASVHQAVMAIIKGKATSSRRRQRRVPKDEARLSDFVPLEHDFKCSKPTHADDAPWITLEGCEELLSGKAKSKEQVCEVCVAGQGRDKYCIDIVEDSKARKMSGKAKGKKTNDMFYHTSIRYFKENEVKQAKAAQKKEGAIKAAQKKAHPARKPIRKRHISKHRRSHSPKCVPCKKGDAGCTHPGNADQKWCDSRCKNGLNDAQVCPKSHCACKAKRGTSVRRRRPHLLGNANTRFESHNKFLANYQKRMQRHNRWARAQVAPKKTHKPGRPKPAAKTPQGSIAAVIARTTDNNACLLSFVHERKVVPVRGTASAKRHESTINTEFVKVTVCKGGFINKPTNVASAAQLQTKSGEGSERAKEFDYTNLQFPTDPVARKQRKEEQLPSEAGYRNMKCRVRKVLLKVRLCKTTHSKHPPVCSHQVSGLRNLQDLVTKHNKGVRLGRKTTKGKASQAYQAGLLLAGMALMPDASLISSMVV